MKKLHLDDLAVESFSTGAETSSIRGTVAARENTGTGACPDSWDGTCWVTCWETCYCETVFEC